ncbi:hypothetical protein [Saccharopolyspora elongata]|uniref:Transposase n=1 Tax=Saccharopolyspora elongata TaxID=2530387 RepID=A0A4R4XWW6_9PSEU|nr:hypothetical protein [Saccharopolyspora elongata]TDD36036.1 hypothetical protein E1288_42520 [Saccharopolyspora elongata]
MPNYPYEFRRQMVEQVRAGRPPGELAQLRRENKILCEEKKILRVRERGEAEWENGRGSFV